MEGGIIRVIEPACDVTEIFVDTFKYRRSLPFYHFTRHRSFGTTFRELFARGSRRDRFCADDLDGLKIPHGKGKGNRGFEYRSEISVRVNKSLATSAQVYSVSRTVACD